MFDPTLGADVPQKLALQTRRGGVVSNLMNPASPHDGVQLQIDFLKAKYSSARHRDVGPSSFYNCHGLTFAARRTGICEAAQVQKILSEDGYTKLATNEPPMPGDVAVYTERGDIIHSGIVVGAKGDVPWILGKWGDCHEVVHAVQDCPYNKGPVHYYRITR